MPIIKRNQLATLLQETNNTNHRQVYLFFGERYLCRKGADQLQERLCADGGGTVHTFDGDREDPTMTLARLMGFSLLPGLQIYRINDSKLFHSKKVGTNIWDKITRSHAEGKPSLALRHLNALLSMAGISYSEGERLVEIDSGRWKKLFGFARPTADLAWADELLSQSATKSAKKKRGGETVDLYLDALKRPPPASNILLLCAEDVDKRKKLFTHIKKEGMVVDLSVISGSSSGAQREQQSVLQGLVNATLKRYNKKIEGRALKMLFERVGFHPVAVVTECEKLALFVDDRDLITHDDLEMMVGRSREDALFELTEAFGKRQIGTTLTILGRLLENGIHSLAILATMRNYVRKLLLFRSFQHQDRPVYSRSINANQFQNQYLPALKKSCEWPDLLKGHPYGLYMSFSKANEFSCVLLKHWLTILLTADYRLKGSPLEQRLVLEEMFLSLFKQNR